MLLAAAALLVAEPMLASPSLVTAVWVRGWQQGLGAIWQQLVVGAALLYPACVSGGLLLELLTPHLHRLEAPLRAVHKTRDCVACLFLFAPLFALGLRHAPPHACAPPPAHSPPISSSPRRLTRAAGTRPLSQVCFGYRPERTRSQSFSNPSSTLPSTTSAGTYSSAAWSSRYLHAPSSES